MAVFISYSRRDEDVVKSLVRGLEAANQGVWLDQDLRGGDSWWSVILEKIQNCSVFVFALSDASIYSKPCRAELAYAESLQRPIVPVQVGDVANLRASRLSTMQVVAYRPDNAVSAFSVLAAVQQSALHPRALPNPLPEPPPIPFAYLLALGAKIEAGELNNNDQLRIVDDLRRALVEEPDEGVRDDITRMLRDLRGKPWRTVATERAVAQILDEDSTGSADAIVTQPDGPAANSATPQPGRNAAPPGWYPDPSQRHQWRWFEDDWTQWASTNGVVAKDPL
jgi:serine/threonine kinase PknH